MFVKAVVRWANATIVIRIPNGESQRVLSIYVCLNVALCAFGDADRFVNVLLVRCLFEFLTFFMLLHSEYVTCASAVSRRTE